MESFVVRFSVCCEYGALEIGSYESTSTWAESEKRGDLTCVCVCTTTTLDL